MQKILTIYYTHKPGGLCKRLYRFVDALSSAGHAVTFLSLDPESLNCKESSVAERIPFPLRARSGLFFWICFSLWCPLYALWWSIKNPGYRAFVFNPYYGVILLPARLLNVCSHVTYFYRSVGSRTYQARKMHLLRYVTAMIERFTYSIADRVVTQTRTMHDQLSNHSKTEKYDWHLLPNDVPVISQAAAPSNSQPITCITVGMFDEGKNLPLLLETFSHLSVDNFQLLVIGDGPVVAPLRTSYGSMENVLFLGWVSDVQEYYQKADILIHPSFNEGMPNVILEALGHDLLVLASNTEEMKELLLSEPLLFNPNSATELLVILERLLSEDSYFEDLQKLCIARKNELIFNWEELAAQILLGEKE